MRMLILLLGGFAVLAITCGPRDEHAETQTEGERLFRANCQTCHRLPDPKSKSDADWPHFVQRYGERARLSESQIALITAHLQGNNERSH